MQIFHFICYLYVHPNALFQIFKMRTSVSSIFLLTILVALTLQSFVSADLNKNSSNNELSHALTTTLQPYNSEIETGRGDDDKDKEMMSGKLVFSIMFFVCFTTCI